LNNSFAASESMPNVRAVMCAATEDFAIEESAGT
jgi:hypothetical protein